MDFEEIPERFLDSPEAGYEGEAAEAKAAQVTYMKTRAPLEKLRKRCTDLTGPQRVDVRRMIADFYREYGRVELKLWNFDEATERFARGCRLGVESTCETAKMVHGLELPEADHIQAEAAPGSDYRIAGPAGVTMMDEMLFDWPEVQEWADREVEITKKTDQSNKPDAGADGKTIEVKTRSMKSVVGGASDEADKGSESTAELEPPERYQYGHPLADLVDNRPEIGGGRFRDKTHAVTLLADRGLPARHLAAIARHVNYGHPESDKGLLAVLTRRRDGGETRRGWQLVSGEWAADPGATLRITPAGYAIEVGGESLAPVEGCPSDGPTVCLARSPEKVEAALSRHADGYGERKGDDETLEQVVEDYRVDGLDGALSKAGEKSGGEHPGRLQIVADGRLPRAVITRVTSTALFETETTGERSRVVGGRFGEMFVAVQ